MTILGKIFTWWDGATIGTAIFSAMNGRAVGEDHLGNRYFQSKKAGKTGQKVRRWVIYNGANDASRVPPEWHGWLHHSYDEVPESHLPPARIWEREPTANLTGTARAYRPQGALEAGGIRAHATGDYEPWAPGDS
jgi:NADH:ubiquinone oxidoreductase subunit